MTDQHTPIRPTPERMKQGGVIPADPGRGRDTRPWLSVESNISHYLVDGTITRRQAEAGYQFQRVYYTAHRHPLRAQSYEPPIRGGDNDAFADGQLAARGKLGVYREAHGPDLYACLVGIAGLGQSHTVWAKGAGMHASAGRPIMRIALTKHADLLRLSNE
jgi:hypothetical protein